MKVLNLMLVAVALMTTASCINELGTDQAEGKSVGAIKLSISVPKGDEVIATKGTDAQETLINHIALLFYKTDNSKPIVVESSTSELATEETSTSYLYTVSFNTPQTADRGNSVVDSLKTGDWYLYAIGNYTYTNFGDVDMSTIRGMTKKQMDSYILAKNNDLTDFIDNGLLMTGKYGTDGKITLTADDNDFTSDGDASIHLRRVTAKITFNIAAGADIQFVPVKYFIYNYSQSCTLMERTGWTQADGTINYENGTFPGKLKYSGNNNFSTEEGFVKDNSFTFYMPENVQTSKSTVSEYNDREKRNATTSDPTNRDFLYAPDNGTYILLYGIYRDANYVGDVYYTIHLGNFSSGENYPDTKGSYDNFTVRRNTKYTYNINIKGVNKIIIEAKAETELDERNSGAEGLVVDNSTGTAIELDSHFETVMIKIPESAVNEYINTYGGVYQMYVTTPYGTDTDWVKFAKPVAADQFPAYPGSTSDELVGVEDLMLELKDFDGTSSGDHYLYSDGYIYVTAFVNEYYYDTNPKTGAAASLSEFVNAADRKMMVTTNKYTSWDQHSIFYDGNLFAIQQTSIKSMYDLSVDNPMGIEAFEEFSDPMAEKAEKVSTDSENWGWGNFTSNFSLGTDKWSDYVAPAKLGHFDNYNEMSTDGIVQQYGDLQCITRNRDENGNGYIDKEEMKWYLPSHNECLTIWNGDYALSDIAKVNNSEIHYCSSNGSARFWWTDEGSAFGTYNSVAAPMVRCTRALKTYNVKPTSISEVSGQVIKISGLGAGAVRSTGKVGEYTLWHYRNEAPDILPTAFVVSKADLSTGSLPYTIVTIAPQIESSGYDANGIWFHLENYEGLTSDGYTLYYTIGSSTDQNAITSSYVSGITPDWSDDGAVVNIYSQKTNGSSTYTSNVSKVTVKRSSSAKSKYLYTTTVTHGANNTLGSVYPYVGQADYSSNRLSFTVSNYYNIGTETLLPPSIQKGTSGSYGGGSYYYYPYVSNATIDGQYLRLSLDSGSYADFTDGKGYYHYVFNDSGKAQNEYSGGQSLEASQYPSIDISGLTFTNNTATVTIYSTYLGGVFNHFDYPDHQTIITITRNFTRGKPYYSVNGGTAYQVTSEETQRLLESTDWNGNTVTVKVFNQNAQGSDYISTITLTKSSSDYGYTSTSSNGSPIVTDTNYTNSQMGISTTVSLDQFKVSNFCEDYYYENSDKSDLGKWRIPNERELGLMFEHFYDSITGGTTARTFYWRKYDATPTAQPYAVLPSKSNIFCGGNVGGVLSNNVVIRCVRDYDGE